MDLGKALHSYGAAANNLEQALTNLSNTLGLESQFFATPTLLLGSFVDKVSLEKFQAMTRVTPGIVELEKMAQLDAIGDKVTAQELNLDIASKQIEEIIQAPRLYSSFYEILAYIVVAAASTIFFKGGLIEMLVSMFCGAIVGIIGELTMGNDRASKFFEFLAAFVVSLLSAYIYTFYPHFSLQIVNIASLIVLIPGLTLTISVSELATNNLASGTARLMQAILVFFKLGFGVALGSSLVEFFTEDLEFLEKAINPIPDEFLWLSLIFAAWAFTVLFRAKMKDFLWVLLAGAMAYFSTKLASDLIGPDLGTFTGGFVVGSVANIYAGFMKKPGALIFMPGLILLVPGSIGFRGLAFLVERNTLAGIDTTFQMFLASIALVSGLLLANILVSPRRSL